MVNLRNYVSVTLGGSRSTLLILSSLKYKLEGNSTSSKLFYMKFKWGKILPKLKIALEIFSKPRRHPSHSQLKCPHPLHEVHSCYPDREEWLYSLCIPNGAPRVPKKTLVSHWLAPALRPNLSAGKAPWSISQSFCLESNTCLESQQWLQGRAFQ